MSSPVIEAFLIKPPRRTLSTAGYLYRLNLFEDGKTAPP
jgi:hypothetical protein